MSMTLKINTQNEAGQQYDKSLSDVNYLQKENLQFTSLTCIEIKYFIGNVILSFVTQLLSFGKLTQFEKLSSPPFLKLFFYKEITFLY